MAHAGMLVDCRKCSIPFTPTRGQWETEPNAGAAQGVSSPVSRPEPVQPRPHQAPRVFQLRETPQEPGPDPPPLLPAYGHCLMLPKLARKCPSRRLWEADTFEHGLVLPTWKIMSQTFMHKGYMFFSLMV